MTSKARRIKRDKPFDARGDHMSHHILQRPDGEHVAFKRVDGAGPTVLWVGGFRSDMEGTKALALEQAARERGWAYVR